MGETWRLIFDSPLPGHVNMERDLDIHKAVSRGEQPPTLRFYSWSPPAVSLGFFQKEEDVVDIGACQRLGVDVVRRPTGGRALLHHRELTYSLAVKDGHPRIPNGVLESYKLFSRGITNGLASLNIEATLASGENRGRGQSPGACFDTPSAFEVQILGKKVVGSAQFRRHGALLQHGAVLLELSLDLYRQVLLPTPALKGGSSHLASLEERAAGLKNLGYHVEEGALARALTYGFSQVLEVDFTTGKEVFTWTNMN